MSPLLCLRFYVPQVNKHEVTQRNRGGENGVRTQKIEVGKIL